MGSSQAGRYPRVGAPIPLRAIFLIPTHFWKFGHQYHFQLSWCGHLLGVSKICIHCFCGQPRMQVTPEDGYQSAHGHRSLWALCCHAFTAAVPGIQAVAYAYDSLDVCLQDGCVLLNCHLAPTRNLSSQEKAWSTLCIMLPACSSCKVWVAWGSLCVETTTFLQELISQRSRLSSAHSFYLCPSSSSLSLWDVEDGKWKNDEKDKSVLNWCSP